MKHLKAYVETVKASKDDVVRVIGSTSAKDRHGESINQEGWDLKNYKKNPVILWGHNSGMGEQRPPIGKAVKVWVEGKGKTAKLMFDVVFDMADDFARQISQKVKDGFVNAVSVGFRPTDIEGREYLKMELLELSFVPVPANPQAIVQLKEMGVTPTDWKGKEVTQEDADVPEEVEETTEEKPEEVVEEENQQEEEKEENKAINNIREAVKELDDVQEFTMSNLKEVMKILNQASNYALKKLRESRDARQG